MAAVAPKSFTQLRNAITVGAAAFGYWTGIFQKANNEKLWDTHIQNQLKEAAAAHAAAHPAPVGEIPAIVPTELHGVYKDLTSGH